MPDNIATTLSEFSESMDFIRQGCPVKEKCIRQKKTDKTPLEDRVKRLNVSMYFAAQREAMEEKISKASLRRKKKEVPPLMIFRIILRQYHSSCKKTFYLRVGLIKGNNAYG